MVLSAPSLTRRSQLSSTPVITSWTLQGKYTIKLFRTSKISLLWWSGFSRAEVKRHGFFLSTTHHPFQVKSRKSAIFSHLPVNACCQDRNLRASWPGPHVRYKSGYICSRARGLVNTHSGAPLATYHLMVTLYDDQIETSLSQSLLPTYPPPLCTAFPARRCPSICIGETTCTLWQHFGEHLRSFTKSGVLVVEHFSSNVHSFAAFSSATEISKWNTRNEKIRLIIDLVTCQPRGLYDSRTRVQRQKSTEEGESPKRLELFPKLRCFSIQYFTHHVYYVIVLRSTLPFISFYDKDFT